MRALGWPSDKIHLLGLLITRVCFKVAFEFWFSLVLLFFFFFGLFQIPLLNIGKFPYWRELITLLVRIDLHLFRCRSKSGLFRELLSFEGGFQQRPVLQLGKAPSTLPARGEGWSSKAFKCPSLLLQGEVQGAKKKTTPEQAPPGSCCPAPHASLWSHTIACHSTSIKKVTSEDS